MGWVSFLEDKIERLNSELELIRRSRKPDSRTKSTKDTEKHLDALIRVCEQFMVDIRKHLDLATDPDVDVVHEVLQLRKDNAKLLAKVAILADTEITLAQSLARCERLQKDFDRANGRAGKNYAQFEEMTRRYKHLEKEHTKLKRGRHLH